MKLVLWFVFAICICVCGSGCEEPEVDWYGDERFAAEERAEIERGAAWLYEQAGLPPPRISWTYEVGSAQRLSKTIRRERGPWSSRGETGLCWGSTIYLDPVGLPEEQMELRYLAGLTAHELAHCVLGLSDDFESEGIMHVFEPMRWTEREAAQLAMRRAATAH